MLPANTRKPYLTIADEAWIAAGEIVFQSGPNAAPLPPLDNPAIQRLWLGGFAMAWLDAMETSAATENNSVSNTENKVRTALAERLAGHPALLAKLKARGHNNPL